MNVTAIKQVCVFCGSKTGTRPVYREAAESLGRAMVARELGLVYGGGSVGLMGVLADAVLGAGGSVVGVIPERLATTELLHAGVRTMHVTTSMHARKSRMDELADAFIAMPGGFGTFEELLEMITWSQLGIHRKPVGLLNVAGYFDRLIQFFDHAIAEGFIRPKHRQLFVIASDPAELLDLLARHRPPVEPKFVSLAES